MRNWIKKRLLAALRGPWQTGTTCGYVTWCATPPVGLTQAVHSYSINEAFETAAAFIHGEAGYYNPLAAKLVVGAELATVCQRLPFFVPDLGQGSPSKGSGLIHHCRTFLPAREPGPGCLRIGCLNIREIFYDPNLGRRDGYLILHDELTDKDYRTLISIVD